MRVKKTIVGALAGILLLGVVGIPSAQAVTPMPNDPGPAGDFTWEGFNWQKRSWSGSPMYNGSYSANNVSNPNANGYVTLSLSNPTGIAPSAAEFQSTRRGFGYGTYTATVEKNLNSLQKETVWGCLFTYDQDSPPGMNEIDLCEASAWGGGASYGQSWPVTQGHGYWIDATKPPGVGNNTVVFNTTDAPLLTHQMVWEPGKITFETYAGSDNTGTLLKRTVLQGSTIPVPAKENVVFNLWVTGGGGGDPAHVKPESVVLRDFSFTPAAAPAVTPIAAKAASLNGSLGTAKSGEIYGIKDGGGYQCFQLGCIIWSPATGAHVSLGGIRSLWAATGYENGGLGYPTTDEIGGLKDGGVYQNYQGGAIIWSPSTGAHVSVGGIRNLWAATGYENGGLGYPTSNEIPGLKDGGVYQNYQGGAIIWSPGTGAHVSVGGIRGMWAATGFENGGLGYPISNEVAGLKNGGVYQNYQGGAIIWSPASGAHVSVGGIRAAWAATGFENGRLGYPTSNEYITSPGHVSQNYQGGTISWNSSGTTITYN